MLFNMTGIKHYIYACSLTVWHLNPLSAVGASEKPSETDKEQKTSSDYAAGFSWMDVLISPIVWLLSFTVYAVANVLHGLL